MRAQNAHGPTVAQRVSARFAGGEGPQAPPASDHQPSPPPAGGADGACAGRGRVSVGQPRQPVSGGLGRALVYGARLRRTGTRAGGRRADAALVLFATLRRQNQRTERSARRETDGDAAVRRGAGVLRGVRFRCERHPSETDVVLPQPDRQAGKEEDHLAAGRLSRRHRRERQPYGPGALPQAVRPADSRHPAHGQSALLPPRARGGNGGRVCHPPRQRTRRPHRRRRPGDHRRIHRGARAGRRRRHRAAGRLLRESAGRAGEAPRALHRRRGDLRLRAHRRAVWRPDDGHRTHHHQHGEGVVLRLPADFRGGAAGVDARRLRRGQRGIGQLRPRLHLFGAPRLRGGGLAQFGANGRTGRPQPRGPRRRSVPGAADGLGRPPPSGRSPRQRAHRRGGVGGEQGDAPALRRRVGHRRLLHGTRPSAWPHRAQLGRFGGLLPAAHHHGQAGG